MELNLDLDLGRFVAACIIAGLWIVRLFIDDDFELCILQRNEDITFDDDRNRTHTVEVRFLGIKIFSDTFFQQPKQRGDYLA